MRRLSTTYRLTLLLALLSTVPMFVLVFRRAEQGFNAACATHVAESQQLALACALNLRDRDYVAIEALIDSFSQSANATSVRLVRFDGLIVHQNGFPPPDRYNLDFAPKSAADIRIPLNRDGRQWGTLQTVYPENTVLSQLSAMVRPLLTTFCLNLFTFGLLLRRSLAVLDAGKAVPKRVRNTLDTIVGGVVILDGKRRIVMANEAFQKSIDCEIDEILGKELREFGFAISDGAKMPWDVAMDTKERQVGATLHLQQTDDEARSFVVNATPVLDANDSLAGILVSFEDVTVLERQKQNLISAMSELETSKDEIRQQNLRLQELASRDALTGVFNRRALFERFEKLWTERSGGSLGCIMLDVDHFKKLNDGYGHAVGDQVLRDVARIIQENVVEPGFVGRYGGEEFCVVLPATDSATSAAIGEQIRAAIEAALAEPYHVTASFGVSGVELGAANFQAMLEQADQALYHAKDSGRNAVVVWDEDLVAAEQTADSARASQVDSAKAKQTDEQPISYHAVASLHAALAYRDADTALHSQRVAELAVALGRGMMSVGELYVLEIAGILHDIGKVGVPDSILLKPGKLDDEEWKVMEAHARMGVEIVESSFDSTQLSDIVRFHHYRYDGTNTPPGAPIGKDIPLGARIVCIVDAFDAMVSNRVYRKGRPAEQAFEELRRCAGTQFDPDLVERFVELKTGWRADSRYLNSDFDDRVAVSIGHLTERTLFAFEAREEDSLISALLQLENTAKKCELTAVAHLSGRLREFVTQENSEDWDEALSILQDLLEMCMTVQRAHIRGVAARPQITENCPQQAFYTTARTWDQEQQQTST